MADDALNKKLKALIAFRAFFVTLLLGSFLVFQIGYGLSPYPAAVQYLIVLLFAATIVYSFLLGRVRALPLAYVQVCMDVVAAVALILFTGGIESWFPILLLIIVLEAAIVIDKRGGYVAAILGSLLYGLAVDLQYYGVIPLPFDPLLHEKDFLYKIFSMFAALYLTAYLIGILTSRLERKHIDLEDLALFNREVIENTPSGLFTTDTDGFINLFNRAAERITGIDRSGAIGMHVGEVFPFIRDLAVRQRIEEAVRFGDSTKIIGLSLSLMKDTKDNVIGYTGIFQDLTRLKKMAEEIKQKERLAAIGEMSANMAHEIRNPLASLKSSMEMLRENVITEGQKERLMGIALSEMDRLNNIITEFLDYSRPTSINKEEFDLNSALEQTIELLRNRDSTSSSIVFRKSFSGSGAILGDQEKLKQVFWNLGLNALDAMPGGGELSVATEERDGNVRITFRDTGEGISSENLKKVFYPFFTTKKGGTGLGLSIAYRIIEGHGGSLSIESLQDKGTQFDILLPRGKRP